METMKSDIHGNARMEWVIKMSEDRHKAQAEKNVPELERIAKEYAVRGLTTAAKEIQILISLWSKPHG